MISRHEFENARLQAIDMITKAGIVLSNNEKETLEVVDFGLSKLNEEGAQIATLVQTERLSVKLLALFPNQTEPEHWHPAVGDDPGKEETIRMVSGLLYFYIPGEDSVKEGCIPSGKEECYTVRQEVVMQPGDQLTLSPGTKHWFQAGSEGAVFYSFSTIARDVLDKFTDPAIQRITQIADE